jgi:Predicted enzyme with a TIM-barrel fold
MQRVARACERAGRKPDDVLLIAVSKTVEIERIRLAVTAGVQALGENRVQEAKDKVAALGRPVPWHLIGSLQTNKARDAVEAFRLDPFRRPRGARAGARPACPSARAAGEDPRAGERGRGAPKGWRASGGAQGPCSSP